MRHDMLAGLDMSKIEALPKRVLLLPALQVCLAGVYIVYFGVIALATWLDASWLTHWFSWWTPVTDLLRQIVPTFDSVERELVAKGFAGRVDVIHHLLTIGWFFFISGFTASIVILLKLSRADWNLMPMVWPKKQGLVVALPLLFAASLYVILVLNGHVNENPLYAAHRRDIALVGLAAGFLFAQMTGVFGLIGVGIWLTRRKAGSQARHR